MSGFTKVLAQGEAGSVTLNEAGGVVALIGSANVSIGGGAVAGFIKVKNDTSIELSAKQLIDGALDLIAHSHPTAAPGIAGLKAIIDAAEASI